MGKSVAYQRSRYQIDPQHSSYHFQVPSVYPSEPLSLDPKRHPHHTTRRHPQTLRHERLPSQPALLLVYLFSSEVQRWKLEPVVSLVRIRSSPSHSNVSTSPTGASVNATRRDLVMRGEYLRQDRRLLHPHLPISSFSSRVAWRSRRQGSRPLSSSRHPNRPNQT